MHALIRFLSRFDKPIVAAIHGAAVAGGLTLALACDFRIAAESARLGDTSLKFALIPDEGGAYFFPRAMGMDRALKMSLLSEVYTARQALELGLVTEVVADAELMAAARGLAERPAGASEGLSGRSSVIADCSGCWAWETAGFGIRATDDRQAIAAITEGYLNLGRMASRLEFHITRLLRDGFEDWSKMAMASGEPCAMAGPCRLHQTMRQDSRIKSL
jgi:enoyl-CoA hydratase/carnithine racemase